MQLAHALVSLFICRVFRMKPHASLAEHEGKRADVARKLREREVVRLDLSSGEQGKLALFLRLQIIKDKPGKVRHEDEARNFFPALLSREVLDVGEGLRLREGE